MSQTLELFLILIIIIVPLIAQMLVSSSFNKYSKEENKKKITGQEVARKILDKHGLSNIYVVETPGNLTDHYDPKRKVVRLSPKVYEGTSIASLAVAAHECGHAIQDKEGYAYMRFRSLIYPPVRIATSISYWIILLGFLFEIFNLIYLGIFLTCFGLLFQIVTLPVEFNASSRAKDEIEELNLATEEEAKGVRKVLTSATLTYVAGVLASALQVLRLILIANDRRN